MTIIILGNFFILSLCLNIFLSFQLRKKLKKNLTIDAQKLLSELAGGRALLQINVLDPAEIFLRSPGQL